MVVWHWLGVALGVLFAGDALRLRALLEPLPVIPPEPPAPSTAAERYALWTAPEVEFPTADFDAAAAHADAHGLELLELLPRRWSVPRALGAAQLLSLGAGAGQAMVVSRTLLARAGRTDEAPRDEASLFRAARFLTQYARGASGTAVSSGLRVGTPPPGALYAVYRAASSMLAPCLVGFQGAFYALALLCAWRGGWLGACAVAGWMAQPLLALAGGPLRAGDLIPRVLFAVPLGLWDWLRLLAADKRDPARTQAVDALRAPYRSELEPGVQRYLEARQEQCYVCGGRRLAPYQRFSDFWQGKPGRFVLERCEDCGHVAQNPRLTTEGLSFYYRDFYDGLGADALDLVFGINPVAYEARARFVGEPPESWLDVGGGYGHFCAAARRVFPLARFECLDMGSGVDEAVRRGWADKGYRGQFPEIASKLPDGYDVVSMSHYLEHTRDPRAELSAAFRVLAPGGRLFVEVPDPECFWRHALGRFWVPYLQPQHLHLLSVKNLTRLAQDAGFTVERVERGAAKLGDDFTLACLLWMRWLAPEEAPWRPPGGEHRRFLVPFLATPLLAAAWLVDRVTRRLRFLPGGSNAFRLLARKPAAS